MIEEKTLEQTEQPISDFDVYGVALTTARILAERLRNNSRLPDNVRLDIESLNAVTTLLNAIRPRR